MTKPDVVLEDLTLPEGLRWRDGWLWFSDLLGHRVMRTDAGGRAEVLAAVAGRPSGLGFTPDGHLLVVSMRENQVLRLGPDGLEVAADLSPLARAYCNDMVVDGAGRAYVGDVGFDRHAGEPPRNGALLRLDPDGTMAVAADDINFPNGAVLTPDGRTLILAETFANRLTAFDVDDAGGLHRRRLFAEIAGTPDGIALDAEGAIWVADHLGHKVLRVLEGGRVTHTIDAGERHTFACALGGPERRTLFFSTSIGNSHPEFERNRLGRIEALEVAVPGV